MRNLSLAAMNSRRKHSKHKSMATPDVTFIFAEDVLEWDSYLSRQFEGNGTVIHHEQVEKMDFPLACTKTNVFSDARVVLIILSPALVNFLDRRASDSFQFTKLLKPSKTIAMVCGASSAGIAAVKNVLISYDEWKNVEAKDKDINMVRSVIEMIQESLTFSKEIEKVNKPKFKLVPRKVQQGNGKVYIILNKENNAKIRVTLEFNGAREIAVKRRNPYTLTFVIPDELIHVQNFVNVHVWCGEDLLGVSPVKCVSKVGELYNLLHSASSPYEFLCNTLGVSSLHEVDAQLSAAFKKNMAISGFSLLNVEGKTNKMLSKEEFPTLLHFAAQYGLNQLVNELLSCPNAQLAVTLKNKGGFTAAQLANCEGHNKIAATIENFGKAKCVAEELDVQVPCSFSAEDKKCPLDYYDVPAQPVPVLHIPDSRKVGSTSNEREYDYMKMKGAQKENVEPLQSVFLEEHMDSMKTNPVEKPKLTLLESQAKLIDIMEAYKKGASLLEVEKLHNQWKSHYQVSDIEAKSTLDGLRNLYAKAQKSKLHKKHSTSFSELRQFFNSKLRRKESIETKGTMSRRNSKNSTSSENFCTEPESPRPISTLSVLSNTSSSSGSSFDRLSMASAGSDSGHHSDYCDERTNKLRNRSESMSQQKRGYVNTMNLQKNVQPLNLNSKPPAPPPRPVKLVLHPGTTEVPQYAVAKKMVSPSVESVMKPECCSQPCSRSSTLGSEFRTGRKASLPVADSPFFENDDYDRPPAPRPSSSLAKRREFLLTPVPLSPIDSRMDYDFVPPPLPVSAPPLKPAISSNDHSHDIIHRSLSTDYDIPRSNLLDNTDLQPACTCQMAATHNNLSSVKSCCLSNKLSNLESLPSVPNFDIHSANEDNLSAEKVFREMPRLDKTKTSIDEKMVPRLDMTKTSSNEKMMPRLDMTKISSNGKILLSSYCNVFLEPAMEERCNRDSIPEEMAPPPPVIVDESSDDHYKMVGVPIPIKIL